MAQVELKRPQSMTPFYVLWGGQAISLFGSAMVQFALIWWITAETGSGVYLAVATLMGFLPQVLLGPFIGAWIDRWPRRQILLWADLLVAAASLGLMALFLLGMVAYWHVLIILLIRAIGGAFHRPTMMATTPLMVPSDQLTHVNSLNQLVQGAVSIAAAPLGALLLVLLSEAGILMIDALTAVVAIIPLFFIAIPEIKDHSAEGSGEGQSSMGKRFGRGSLIF